MDWLTEIIARDIGGKVMLRDDEYAKGLVVRRSERIASAIREEIRKRRPKDGYMVAYATGVATRNQALREYDKALGLEDK